MNLAAFRVSSVLWLALVVGAASGGCLRGVNPFPDPGIPSGFCEATVKASCKLQFQCCTADERFSRFGGQILNADGYRNENECQENLTPIFCFDDEAKDDSVKAERASFDAEAARACVDALNKAADTCDGNTFFNTAGGDGCDVNLLFRGAVDEEGDCSSAQECLRENALCQFDDPDPADNVFVVDVDGKCRGGLPRVGEACPAAVCETGSFCADNLCEPLLGDGETCAANEQCESASCVDTVCGPTVTLQFDVCSTRQ